MNEEFHKPFIKSLIIAAIVTVFAMVSSNFVVNYYYKHSLNPVIFTSSSPASPEN